MKPNISKLHWLTISTLLAAMVNAQQPLLPPKPPVADANFAPAQRKPLVDPNKVLKEGVMEPQMGGETIAQHYRKYTGKRVIITKAVQGIEISFVQPGPLTYREAADLLVKTCFLEGLVFVPSGPNEVKLLPGPVVRKAGGFPIISDPLLLPEDSEELVTYVMGFQNIKPEEAMSIFTGVISQLDSYGSIVPVPNASALVITENSQLIKTLIELKNRIDIPQELSTQKWIPLSHADAEGTAESVKAIMEFSAQKNTLLAASASTSRSAPIPGVPASARPGAVKDVSKVRSAGGESFSSVQVIADARTNRIFLIGRPIDVEVAEGLVRGFDSPLDERNFYKHKLKFLSVSDFLSVAENAITQVSLKSSDGSTSSPKTRQSTNRSNSTNRRNNNSNTNSQSGSSSGLADTARDEGPEALIIGKTLLVADNSNNTLIIKGPPSSIKVVKDLIEEMDVAADQVQITAIFGRYNIGDSVDFGVDFARTYQKTRGANSGFAGQNRTGFPNLADPTALTNLAAFDNIAGLSLYGQIGKHFTATLRAMEESGKFKLMARPTVFTTNNRKAILSSGQQIAVPTNTFTQGGSGNNGSQSTNIAFRDVLLELEVIPLINSNNEVTLQISFVNNNIIGETVIDGNSIPTIGQERILTTVTVPNGETIVLGGLITERNKNTENGIPILMHIPGLKRLFSTVKKEVVREELVIFIQPRIVSGRSHLMQLQERNAQKSQLVRDMQGGRSILPVDLSDPDVQDAANASSQRRKKLWYLPDFPSPKANASTSSPPAKNKRVFKGSRRR